MGLLHRLAVSTFPAIPNPIMRRLAGRYIAGETLEEALTRLEVLSKAGYPGVIDVLGEEVSDEREARKALELYKQAAQGLAERSLDAYVSIKPTHFGLRISPALARDLYSQLLEHCKPLDLFARVEMEDHTNTEPTLQLFADLRRDFENVGIVLQSRLKRTLADIAALPEGAVDVRMVKGIYLEPAAIAHTDGQAIRDAYIACCEALFRAGHTVALATHDEHMAARLLRLAKDLGVDPQRYYFEVLLGVQEPLWERWRSTGNKVRVYVPFGPEWRAYSTRRLSKNPEVFWHVTRSLFRIG